MMIQKGITDDDLLTLLSTVEISHIVSTHGGFNTEKDWSEALSTGIQQRLAMARLFYHSPRFAILDECTSSQDLKTEKIMYEEAKRRGTTLITVSHRRSLWRYHGWCLEFDGVGGARFARLDAERRERLEEEREEIDVKLRVMGEIGRRVRELEGVVEGKGLQGSTDEGEGGVDQVGVVEVH